MRLAPQETRTFFVSATTSGGRRLLQSRQAARLFLEIIQRNRELKRMQVHEYVVMPNHVHLILTPAEGCSLEDCMRYLKGGYSFEAGKRFGNKGVWQAGYNEQRIKTDDEYDAVRSYIWQNPVKAGLAVRAEEYEFSSAHPNAAVDPSPAWFQRAGAKAQS